MGALRWAVYSKVARGGQPRLWLWSPSFLRHQDRRLCLRVPREAIVTKKFLSASTEL
jgi:hypothetical protein